LYDTGGWSTAELAAWLIMNATTSGLIQVRPQTVPYTCGMLIGGYRVDHAHTISNLTLPFDSRETVDPFPARSFGCGCRRHAAPPDTLESSRRVLGGRSTKRLQRHTFPAIHTVADYLGFLRETRPGVENGWGYSRIWRWGHVLGLGIHRVDLCIHPKQGAVRLATWADLGGHHVAEFSGVVVVGWIGDGGTPRRYRRC